MESNSSQEIKFLIALGGFHLRMIPFVLQPGHFKIDFSQGDKQINQTQR